MQFLLSLLKFLRQSLVRSAHNILMYIHFRCDILNPSLQTISLSISNKIFFSEQSQLLGFLCYFIFLIEFFPFQLFPKMLHHLQKLQLYCIYMHKQKIDTNQTIYYGFVDKESQSGISWNQRTFFVIQNQLMGYFSKADLRFEKTYEYIKKNAKKMVQLKLIEKMGFKSQEKRFFLRFWVENQQGKKQQKIWNFRVVSGQIINKWQDIFQNFMNRSRNGTIQRPNRGLELLSPQKLNQKMNENNIQQPKNVYQRKESTPKVTFQNKSAESKQSQYFNTRYMVTPQQKRSLFKSFQNQQMSSINLNQQSVNHRQSYFSSKYQSQSKLDRNPSKISFKNYYRPYFDSILTLQNPSLRDRLINQFDTKMQNFQAYCQQRVKSLIDDRISQIVQRSKQSYIIYDEIQDIVIQIGLIQMKKIRSDSYICDQIIDRIIQNRYKNWQFLYDIIRSDQTLMNTFFLPMACTIRYKSYTCYVSSKIQPSQDEHFQRNIPVSNKDVPKLFQKLAQMSKIQFQLFQKQQCIRFVPKNARKDKFVIVQVNKYLPQLQNCILIRQQAFRELYPIDSEYFFSHISNKIDFQGQRQSIKKYISEKAKQLGELMNKLQFYPIVPKEMSNILHSFGLTSRNLSQIHKHTSQFYVNSLIKTQVILRVFATILNKKLQDDSNSSNISENSAKQLINILLGYGQQTNQLWKVVSLHSQIQFSLAVQKQDFNRGYFLLGLSQNHGIQLLLNYSSIDQIFKVKDFLQGVVFHRITHSANLKPLFLRELDEQVVFLSNQDICSLLVDTFNLKNRQLPDFISKDFSLLSKIKHLISFNVSTNSHQYRHLNIYQSLPSRDYNRMIRLDTFYCHRKLIQAKWHIKLQSSEDKIMRILNHIKQIIQNYYGRTHPFISDIYQLQSLYYLQIGEENEAIRVNKDSLANMLQCCGDNNHHLKLSNNYYQLAQCYKKCYKIDECLSNLKKAKNILQINSYQKEQYACILHRIGQIYLCQGKDVQSYELFLEAIKIYEGVSVIDNWGELVQLYQNINRCDFKISQLRKQSILLRDVRLAEHCIAQITKILTSSARSACHDDHFVKIMKIVMQQYINTIRKDAKSMFRSYLIQTCDLKNLTDSLMADTSLERSINYFKRIFVQGHFYEKVLQYVNNIYEILSVFQEQKKIGRLMPHLKNHHIQDYDEFWKNLVQLLGQAFLLNIVK